VQFASHALTFIRDGKVFDASRIFGKLTVGRLEICCESLCLFSSLRLTKVHGDIYTDEDDRRDNREKPVNSVLNIGKNDEVSERENEIIESGKCAPAADAEKTDGFANKCHVKRKDHACVVRYVGDYKSQHTLTKDINSFAL